MANPFDFDNLLGGSQPTPEMKTRIVKLEDLVRQQGLQQQRHHEALQKLNALFKEAIRRIQELETGGLK